MPMAGRWVIWWSYYCAQRVRDAKSERGKCKVQNLECKMQSHGLCDARVSSRKSGFQPPSFFSSRSATARTSWSFHGRPTICTPFGRPDEVRLTRTTAAGQPSRLKKEE